jgi:hypothetical protein
MFVVAQSDEPVRFLAGSPDPRSHKKIIPTRITKNLRPRRAADGVAWLAPVAASDSYRGQSATVRAGLARPTGPWLPFATLEITQTTYRGHDVDLSFDPVLNVVPGLETYDCGLLNYAGSPTPPLAERASTGTVNPRPSRN